MTRQEEMEGKIATILVRVAQGSVNGFVAARQILEYLVSQGVVFPDEAEEEERTKIARSNAIGMGLIDD